MATINRMQRQCASTTGQRCMAFTTTVPRRAGCIAQRNTVARVAQAPLGTLPPAVPTLPANDNELSNVPFDEELLKLPKNYHWYETMLVLRATLLDDDRDRELAKFEAFLNKEGCMHINALMRPRQRMAYPIKGHRDSMYVVYTYAASRQTARKVQLLLSNPEAGSEDRILRHITFCKF